METLTPTSANAPPHGVPATTTPSDLSDIEIVRKNIRAVVREVRILDQDEVRNYLATRQQRDVDRTDEVWDGVYVVAPLANNEHQNVSTALAALFFYAINLEGRGRALAGANVSDRREGWEKSYLIPDVVVVLNGSRAVDCRTHWMGGPDFLVEVCSGNRDATDAKLPFYSRIGVRELLVIDRDERTLSLYRHDGQQLTEASPVEDQGVPWLVSGVIPFAFRRVEVEGEPGTEVRRTDGVPGSWVV